MVRGWPACLALLVALNLAASAGDVIPRAAWKRPIGEPLAYPGGRKPTLPDMIDDGYWQGAPVGGFGAGTFSQTYRGDFARWHMKAGVHKYGTVYANQFALFEKSEGQPAVAQVLAATHPARPILQSWKWDYPVGAGDYYALYPKSWFDYRLPNFPAHVWVEQFSPILPNNYKETSYPVAVYRWHAENPSAHSVTVSVLFSWTNMVGWFRGNDRTLNSHLDAGNVNRFASESLGPSNVMQGIVFDRARKMPVSEASDGQMVIAVAQSPGVRVSYHATFPADGSGSELWNSFAATGQLTDDNTNWVSSGESLAGAIAVTFTLRPGERRVVPMVLAWDFPLASFGQGRQWYRHYTSFYGTSGQNAWRIARDALAHAAEWSDAIDAWQAPYVNDESKPLWYRSMLLNELYILADGGSFWGRPANGAYSDPDVFAFMECYDYPYYDTLDVWFYGSMPVVKFWPDLDKQVLRQFADTVPQDIAQKTLWEWKTQHTGRLSFRVRKAKGAVPHDLGVPDEDPFFQFNQFNWQDTSNWRDLNSKFVLMVWRDFQLTGGTDRLFLKRTWPAVQESLQHLRQYDVDGDGLIESDGFPDQTYDEWIVRGASAYSGGLYLAALRAAEEIGRQLSQQTAAAAYSEAFRRARQSYIAKLWNGHYFRYDTASEYRDDIQADQLAGQWYATATGLGDIVPKEMGRSALETIFKINVAGFLGGRLGAANGMTPDGQMLRSNEQVHEVWTGTTFALAATMLQAGMRDQAFTTVHGIYNVIYQDKGYWFRTPEAWDETGMFRASMYMRPAAIWAMEMTTPPPPPH
jgi:non-lysosomal glucosylceramidase